MACPQIASPLQHVLSKCFEWLNRFPVHFLGGDVLTAFDMMRPKDVAAAMERRGITYQIIAAFLRESVDGEAEVLFQNLLIGIIQITACERTGATDSTEKWNMLLEDCFVRVLPQWRDAEHGLKLQSSRFDHALWAGNVLIFSANTSHLRKTFTTLSLAMHDVNLYWKPEAFVCMSPLLDAPRFLPLSILEPEGARVELNIAKVDTSEQLGVLLCSENEQEAVDFRIGQAVKAFWAEQTLRSRMLSMRERMVGYRERWCRQPSCMVPTRGPLTRPCVCVYTRLKAASCGYWPEFQRRRRSLLPDL